VSWWCASRLRARHEIKGLVLDRSSLFEQNGDETKRRAKHVGARLPLLSDAGSTPAASTIRSKRTNLPPRLASCLGFYSASELGASGLFGIVEFLLRLQQQQLLFEDGDPVLEIGDIELVF